MAKETTQHAFEDELFFSLRRQRTIWARVAVASLVLTFMSLLCVIIILPLNETKPYVVLVDKTTGEAEKIVQVRPANIEQQDAVVQAELVSYITDRETYDAADNRERITDVMVRSKDNAAETLKAVWNISSPTYPPTIYGKDTRVTVIVKSISITKSTQSGQLDIARVRVVKHREDNGLGIVERAYIVTVGYKFTPDVQATLETVWKNPLGFTISTYRIDAETNQ